ncbi:transglycosylase SLT domain-containing protein [Mesorhizobium sp. WSM2240]|uniref:Transglycosylase SLT domain-containing protein n=1 Tax=Mesorhizobium sp. WSM2240 TaxID=3228851 RepID=A0AAU8CTD8_9HYPH
MKIPRAISTCGRRLDNPNFYGNWGGDWAVWGGGTFTVSEKTKINVQLSYDEDEDFAAVANVNYAMGLMQMMPGTWREMRVEHGLGANPHEPRDNILAGTGYLRTIYDRFGFPGLFAAYNAGPERYQEHLQKSKPLPKETISCVKALEEARVRPPTWMNSKANPTVQSGETARPDGRCSFLEAASPKESRTAISSCRLGGITLGRRSGIASYGADGAPEGGAGREPRRAGARALLHTAPALQEL